MEGVVDTTVVPNTDVPVEIGWLWLDMDVAAVAGLLVVENKEEVEDIAEDDMGTGRVLAPASQSLASSFSARRVTSASLAEIASTAVKLLTLPEASSASDILEKINFRRSLLAINRVI